MISEEKQRRREVAFSGWMFILFLRLLWSSDM